MNERNYQNDYYCYVCGKDNPYGLRLDFRLEEGVCITEVTFQKEHQGWRNVVHGGFVAMLLDEVMVNCCYLQGELAVTAELKMRYKCPLEVGQRVEVKGWVEKKSSKLILCQAEMKTRNGVLIATAEGKLIRLGVIDDKLCSQS